MTTRPIYLPGFYVGDPAQMLHELNHGVPFEDRTHARSECFMSEPDPESGARRLYTYGVGPSARTYEAAPFHPWVRDLGVQLNLASGFGTPLGYNVCVLNRYRDEKQALGWHSDDSPEQDLDHPIAVVSFGAPREIWTRPIGAKGVVPAEDRYLLEPGSLFIMPGGYQNTHQHRIPKPFGKCGLRISLTFRKLDR